MQWGKTKDLKICEGAMGCLREQSIQAINVFHSEVSSRELAAEAELADGLQLLPLCIHHAFTRKAHFPCSSHSQWLAELVSVSFWATPVWHRTLPMSSTCLRTPLQPGCGFFTMVVWSWVLPPQFSFLLYLLSQVSSLNCCLKTCLPTSAPSPSPLFLTDISKQILSPLIPSWCLS